MRYVHATVQSDLNLCSIQTLFSSLGLRSHNDVFSTLAFSLHVHGQFFIFFLYSSLFLLFFCRVF